MASAAVGPCDHKFIDIGHGSSIVWKCTQCEFVAVVTDGKSPKALTGVHASPSRSPATSNFTPQQIRQFASNRKLTFASK